MGCSTPCPEATLPRHKVSVERKRACLGVVLVDHVARVVQAHEVATVRGHAATHAGRAGVHAIAVLGDVSHQRRALVLPMQQVGRGEVTPELGVDVGPDGVELEERVVDATELAEAIGVVEPAGLGCDVETEAVPTALCRAVLRFIA